MQRASGLLQEFAEMEPTMTALESPRGGLHVHAREFVGNEVIVPPSIAPSRRIRASTSILTRSDKPLDFVENNVDVSTRSEHASQVKHLSFAVRKLGACRREVCATPRRRAAARHPQAAADLAQHDCLT